MIENQNILVQVMKSESKQTKKFRKTHPSADNCTIWLPNPKPVQQDPVCIESLTTKRLGSSEFRTLP